MQPYELRIQGLKERPGEISADTLVRAIKALISTAERTTRLLATGAGTGPGVRPKWLSACVDLTVTGFRPGSTICDFQAPPLRQAAADALGQQDFWGAKLSLDDTAIDLAARAIKEAQSDNPSGDYFDSSVLEAISSFATSAREPGLRYVLSSKSGEHEKFELDSKSCSQIKARLKDIPAPKPFIVSGRLDEIRHGNGRFSLLVKDQTRLFGRLDTTSLDVETLRPLWGKQTTIEGIVHFKANGDSRLIEARKISSRLEGDSVFEEVPSVADEASSGLFPLRDKPIQSFDPIELAGAWPGDEPLEDLLAQLH